MDILTHTLSGVAAATGIAAFSAKPLWQKTLMICCGAAGAIVPDIDAVTRWSKFDAVIGGLTDSAQSGRSIYFGNHWYSHHNFFHSLAAGAIFTLLAGLLWYLGRRWASKGPSPAAFIQDKKGFLLAFFMGHTMHLLGDLPTPGSTWHGIRLLWPLRQPVGGSGHIWWWNNYDVFLLFLAGAGAGIVLIVLNQFLKKRTLGHLSVLLCFTVFWAAYFQITHRPISFDAPGNHSSHAEKERQSLAVQKTILGERLYGIMIVLDRRLKIPF